MKHARIHSILLVCSFLLTTQISPSCAEADTAPLNTAPGIAPVRAAANGINPAVGSPIVYTGIKAIDLIAPIPFGGDILVTGEEKSGARIMGTELAYRLVNRPGSAAHVVVFLDAATSDLDAYSKELHDAIPTVKDIYTVPTVSGSSIAKYRSMSPAGDAVFAISKNGKFITDFRAAVKEVRAADKSATPLTTFAVTEGITPDGFDAKLVSSRTLASAGIYPALDPRFSTSSVSANPTISSRQRQVADNVRASVSDALVNFQASSFNDPNWSYNTDQSKRPAVQELKFLSQPYFIAEPYTGLKSAFVPIEVTVSNFEAIASGQLVDAPIKTFAMQNALMPSANTAAVATQ